MISPISIWVRCEQRRAHPNQRGRPRPDRSRGEYRLEAIMHPDFLTTVEDGWKTAWKTASGLNWKDSIARDRSGELVIEVSTPAATARVVASGTGRLSITMRPRNDKRFVANDLVVFEGRCETREDVDRTFLSLMTELSASPLV